MIHYLKILDNLTEILDNSTKNSSRKFYNNKS